MISPWVEKEIIHDMDGDVTLYNQDGTLYALHLYCAHCGHEEFLFPRLFVHETALFGADADFCTSCGKWWDCWHM